MYVYVSVCICACVSVVNHGVQKRASDLLDLEFKEVVNCLMWVFGIKVTSSANERLKKASLGLCAPCGRCKFSGKRESDEIQYFGSKREGYTLITMFLNNYV